MSIVHSKSICFSALFFILILVLQSLRARNGLHIWVAFDLASSHQRFLRNHAAERKLWIGKEVFAFLLFDTELIIRALIMAPAAHGTRDKAFSEDTKDLIFFVAQYLRSFFSGGCTCCAWWCYDSEIAVGL